MDDLRTRYESRLSLLGYAASTLEQEVRDYFAEVIPTNQIRFRVMDTAKFFEKAKNAAVKDKLIDPFVEIEDQIIGEVTISPAASPAVIEQRLAQVFSAVEGQWQDCEDDHNEDFPTRRLVCLIPPQVKPPGWDARSDVPKTFEIRIFIQRLAEVYKPVDVASDCTIDVARPMTIGTPKMRRIGVMIGSPGDTSEERQAIWSIWHTRLRQCIR